jgi:hypothetical protein
LLAGTEENHENPPAEIWTEFLPNRSQKRGLLSHISPPATVVRAIRNSQELSECRGAKKACGEYVWALYNLDTDGVGKTT